MPNSSVPIPLCRHDWPSGQAVVTLNGRDFYLGPWKSPEGQAEYDRLIAEWVPHGWQLPYSVDKGTSRRGSILPRLRSGELGRLSFNRSTSIFRRAVCSNSCWSLAVRPIFFGGSTSPPKVPGFLTCGSPFSRRKMIEPAQFAGVVASARLCSAPGLSGRASAGLSAVDVAQRPIQQGVTEPWDASNRLFLSIQLSSFHLPREVPAPKSSDQLGRAVLNATILGLQHDL